MEAESDVLSSDKATEVDPDPTDPIAGHRPNILHVSGDFPDPIEPSKTRVIQTHIDLTSDDFAHQVMSLNRVSPGVSDAVRTITSANMHAGISAREFDHGTALTYKAPGRGIWHATFLRRLGDWLAARLGVEGVPDLLVGHKLTIEGIVVRRAAEQLGIPYAISIQGDTDTKILRARPDLKGEFGRIFHGAEMVFPFAPWALADIEERLGRRAKPVMILPCPTELDEPIAPTTGGDHFLSVFHLKSRKRKNLSRMVQAMTILRQDTGSNVWLAIAGGGSDADEAACRTLIAGKAGISLEGPVSRSDLQQRMNRAIGFVLPSRRESFGLVFIEALFAGLPIIYPKGAAVEGFFDGCEFAIGVPAGDVRAIADAMQAVMENEARLKDKLREWQASEEAVQFTRRAIKRRFASGLAEAVQASNIVEAKAGK